MDDHALVVFVVRSCALVEARLGRKRLFGILRFMRGIVIAGGLGTRLRPLTLTRPKPLMPLVDAPLLEYQLSYLRDAGIMDVCFATNYMADQVEKAFGDGSAYGVRLVYAVESEPLDTGGAIRNAYDAIPGDDCVVFNGDTIHAFDIGAIVKRHRERGCDVTLTLKRVERPHAYGVVPCDGDGNVLGFIEPTEEQKRSVGGSPTGEFDAINAGLYVMSRQALEQIPQRRCNIEREFFPWLISQGAKVCGDIQDAYWIDIGRPAQYLEAVRAVVRGEVKCPRAILRRGDSAVHATAEVKDSAEVCCHSAVGPSVRIGDNVKVCASAVLEGSVIGPRARISNCIVAEECRIGTDVELRNVVLSAGTVVGDGMQIVNVQ